MGAMSSLTDHEYGPEGGAGEGAALHQAPAAGKHSLVEAAMAGSAGGASTPGKQSLVEAALGSMGRGAPMHAGPGTSELAGGSNGQGGMFGSQLALANGANAGGGQQTGPGDESDRIADLVNRGAATDPTSTAPRAFPAPSGSTPRQRHDAAAARFQLIETSIAAEDGTPADRTSVQTKDNSQPDRQTVSHQLAAGGTRQAALDARAVSVRAVAGTDRRAASTAVSAFEVAVRAYQDAYERTYLVSTDAPVDRQARWEPTPQRDRLGSPTVQAKLRTWAEQLPYVKFVIPAGRPTEVYVGDPDLGHIEIANDNALAAGLLKLRTNPLRVSEIENASGGYRPGPLRNALVLARMIDLGYVQEDLSGTRVDHRPDGSYSGSRIDPH